MFGNNLILLKTNIQVEASLQCAAMAGGENLQDSLNFKDYTLISPIHACFTILFC